MHIKGKTSILRKMVFELRYRYGFTYLDKCGRTINSIMREQPEWILKGEVNPQAAGLVSMRNGCLFSFSASNYEFALEQRIGGDSLSEDDTKDFVEQVELISIIVNDQLGLREFARIGFRAWFLFACNNKEESEKWLSSLGCYLLSPNLNSAFEGNIEATNAVAVIAGTDRKFRIAFSGVESHAQVDTGQEILNIRASSLRKDQDKFLRKQMQARHRMRANPKYAAMIDIDAFQEDPLSIDPRNFVETSIEKFLSRLPKAVQK